MIVVDEVLAKRFFPGQSALGQKINTQGDRDFEIVGVTRHLLAYGPGEPEPAPFHQPNVAPCTR